MQFPFAASYANCLANNDRVTASRLKLPFDVRQSTNTPFAVYSRPQSLPSITHLKPHDISICHFHLHHQGSAPKAFTQRQFISSTIHRILRLYLTQQPVYVLLPTMQSLTPPPPYTARSTATMAQPVVPQSTLTSAQKLEMVQAELEVAKLRLRQQTRERQGLKRVAPSRASVLQRLAPKVRLRPYNSPRYVLTSA
jgi:hypothetical protein